MNASPVLGPLHTSCFDRMLLEGAMAWCDADETLFSSQKSGVLDAAATENHLQATAQLFCIHRKAWTSFKQEVHSPS